MEAKSMTASQLIEALKKLNPDAPVLINIRQYNKAQAVLQLPIDTTIAQHGYEMWVGQNYGGSITVHMPEGYSLMNRNKS